VSKLQKICDATPSPAERVGHKVLDAEVPPQQSENVNTGTGTMYTGTGTLYTGTDQDDFGTWSLSRVRARRNKRSAGTGTSTVTSLMNTGTDTPITGVIYEQSVE
jgi:X-X-X-Leu-X-X-Gly heptad repeat protein